IPEYGFMYLISTPFFFIGLYCIFKTIKNKDTTTNNTYPHIENHHFIIIFLWFSISILTALITDVNINRINIIFLPILIFVSIGIYIITNNIRLSKKPIFFTYIIFFLFFSNNYFNYFPNNIGPIFFESSDKAIVYASKNTSGKINVSKSINYTLILFFNKINANLFFNTVKYADNRVPFREVISFDRYSFYDDNLEFFYDNCYIIHNYNLAKVDSSVYNIKEFNNYSVIIRK
ncbi:MAG: hypothetical protein ABF289_00855, partial [Clostridiales bacterium]